MRAATWGVAPMVVAVGIAVGCGGAKDKTPPEIPAAPTPPVAGAIPNLVLSDGWSDARKLPAEINTIGWEDSANVSADGKTLYFSYTQYDYQALASSGQLLVTGPVRPGQHGPAFDIYEATIDGSAWSVADSSVNSSDPNLSEAASGVDVAQDRMVFVNFSGVGDLYLSEKSGGVWQPGVALPSNVNSACVEDNPTLSADGKTIWFDSNRETSGCQDGHGVRQIFVTHETSPGVWSDPVNVTPTGQGYAWQAFVTADGSEMYWAGVDTQCAAQSSTLCIYEAPRASGDSWGTPQIEMMITGTAGIGDAIGLGEVSVTADGHWLYFVYIEKTAGEQDLNIGVVHR